MNTNLKWERGFLSNISRIYSNGRLIGNMDVRAFSNSDIGILNGEKYIFKAKGFFSRHTEIVNAKDHTVVGEITYSGWRSKATLKTPGKNAYWKYDNVWHSRWSISSFSGIEIKYTGSSSSGKIESNTDDPLLLLSGLFVTNYFRQTSIAVMVVIFIPIWTSMWH
ncbi:MAG TPA: hypothetical protein VIK55_10005 [Paludibacter sp.]|nr:hypothetical protein [Prolixibacteraceae bacterium]